jgi:hypothetical protein
MLSSLSIEKRYFTSCFSSLVDLLNRNDFDIGGDVVRAAEIEHLLRLGEAADGRTGEAAAPHDQVEADIARGFSGAPTRVRLPSRRSS